MRCRDLLVHVSYAMTKLTCGILVAFVMQLLSAWTSGAARARWLALDGLAQ
jgi:hypothetical protein